MWSLLLTGFASVGIILIGIGCWLLIVEGKESQRISLIIQQLIARAQSFGLPERDVNNATIMLKAAEYELAFDTVVEQLYENSIQIDAPFYQLATTVVDKMETSKQSLALLKKLIK